MAQQKEATRTLLKCPVCNKKLWLFNVVLHRKQHHAELSHREFEGLLIKAIESGEIVPKVFEGAKPGLESGTQKLAKAKQRNKKGISSIVQGGRTSPK